MKRIKKYLSIFLSIIIFLCCVRVPIIVNATSEPNTFSLESVTINGHSVNAFVYSDPTLLSDTKQFYWVQNGYVQHALYSEALLVMINKKFGIALKPNFFTSLLSWIETNIWSFTSALDSYITGGGYLVSNGSAIIGIAFNDLTGFSLSGDNNYTSFEVPSNIVNNTWNIWNTYIEQNPLTPDYFTVEPMNKAYFEVDNSLSDTYQRNSQVILNYLTDDKLAFLAHNYSHYEGNVEVIAQRWMSGSSLFSEGSTLFIGGLDSRLFVYSTNSTYNDSWNSFCNDNGITENHSFVTYLTLANSTTRMRLDMYNVNTMDSLNQATRYYVDGTPSAEYNGALWIGANGGYPVGSKSFTVYRNTSIKTNIQNNTYQKNYYKSTITNNFNNHNTNNNITITNNDIANSQNNNNSIYNQSTTTTNNNNTTNNYNVDNSQNDNSVTTIINNYYGDNSGGGGDDDDDDDDSIWDALLKALGDFLKKIGELLGTVLTGIISICTSVLDAIASIAESFTGITDFISSIFAFIPSDIVAVLTLGITLAVLISLIKIFRG